MSAPRSIAADAAQRGTSLLVGSFVVLGVVTAGVLHLRAHEALDALLLAAAHGHSRPAVADEGHARLEVEGGPAPAETFVVERDDQRVPAALLDRALRDEEATVGDAGRHRLLLLPAETHTDRGEVHVIVAARAPVVRWQQSVGPFLLTYGITAAAVAIGAGLALRQAVRRAFEPLVRARAETEGVLALGQGQRLTADAPDEVAPLLVAVNGLLDRLDTAWAAQARFTADAAHELRTPVTTMLGELDVALRRDRDAEGYRATLQSTREEVERLRRIVEALTALAKLDAGEAERTRAPTRPRELVERALAAERLTLAPAVVLDNDDTIELNVPLVELALGNLLRNAVRHAPGAPIELRVRRDGPDLRVEVHDGGPGVPPEEREAVFARFGRGARARRTDADGLGLGLAFVREVARRHGGDCTIEASPLGGACAVLTLRASPAIGGGGPRPA